MVHILSLLMAEPIVDAHAAADPWPPIQRREEADLIIRNMLRGTRFDDIYTYIHIVIYRDSDGFPYAMDIPVRDCEEIGRITSIRKLCWKYCNLEQLPPSFRRLVNLEELNLNYNLLPTIPHSILSLQHLTELSLSWNEISTLPDDMGSLSSLIYLWLSHNHIKTIPDSFRHLQHLISLFLDNNLIEHYPEILTQMPNLGLLDITNNYLAADSIPPSSATLEIEYEPQHPHASLQIV